MNTELSMQGTSNQVSSAVRKREENRSAERNQHILYIIWHYLGTNGYYISQDALATEAQLSPLMEVCDNINLEMIMLEYESYYHMRFHKYPMLCKKITKHENVPICRDNKAQNKSTSRSNIKPIIQKPIQQTQKEAATDVNLAISVTPIFSTENEKGSSPSEIPNLQKKQQSGILKHIQELYPLDSELRKIAEDISKEIVINDLNVHWKDVIGLQKCKDVVKAAVVYPLKYPIFFAGKFSHWRGILLYGAPGTGKTLIAKAVATECNCTFFNITASSLVSKWRGDSEKYIRVLFDLAYSQSPAIIFIDEIDWIATKIQDNSLSEPAKRFRSELLARLDGLSSTENSNVVLLAATNAPWNIDKALLRRLEKQIHVPLPDERSRLDIFRLYVNPGILKDEKIREVILQYSRSYSGADIKLVCKDAWILQVTPKWMQLERKEIYIQDLKYEITDFEILLELLQRTAATCTDDNNYVQWQNEGVTRNKVNK